MISDDLLAQEFARLVTLFYPKEGKFLDHCHIRIIESYWGRPPRRLQYIGVYCPETVFTTAQLHREALRDIAANMGLAEVVCLNANRLIRDPMSRLRQVDPKFWLELYWIATQNLSY